MQTRSNKAVIPLRVSQSQKPVEQAGEAGVAPKTSMWRALTQTWVQLQTQTGTGWLQILVMAPLDHSLWQEPAVLVSDQRQELAL